MSHFPLPHFPGHLTSDTSTGTNYIETLRVQIHANCRIRRIYFSDRLYTEDELPQEFKLFLPIQVCSGCEIFFPWFLNINSLSQKSGLHVNRWVVERHVFWNSGGKSRTRYSLACWDFIYMYVCGACILGWHFHSHLVSQRTSSLWNVLGNERWKLMCPSRERCMMQCYCH